MAKSGKKDSILREINDNPLSREEVIAFVTEVAKLSPEDRGFEGHAITLSVCVRENQVKSSQLCSGWKRLPG
jgi:hypothetical protein